MKLFFASMVAALLIGQATAAEMEGAKFDDKVKVAGSDLVINGMGVRTKFGKRYVAALYVGAKSSDANAVISAKGPKRVVLHLLKDGDGKTFAKAFASGIEDNAGGAMGAIQDRVKQLSENLISMGDVAAGARVTIDFVPEKGTQISVNGKMLGKDIPGEDFYSALLKVWLGSNPVQDDLKAGLLGK